MDQAQGNIVKVGGDRQPMAGITFRMDNVRLDSAEQSKRFLSFDALTTVSGISCGLACDILLTGWEKETPEGGIAVYRGDIRFRSLQNETDHFISYLENNFGLVNQSPTVFEKLFCDCAAFLNSPETIETNEFVGRIFFGDGSPPDSDVSVFMIINLSEKRAWFSEKDEAYRTGLIDWFRGKYT